MSRSLPRRRAQGLGLGIALYFTISVCEGYIIVTQNMEEFADTNPQRIDRLLDGLLAQKPDMIFLQEAERQTLVQVKKGRISKDFKLLFNAQGGTTPSGGLIILTKRALEPSPSDYWVLPSDMNRGLLSTKVHLCGKPTTLINLHLESPDPLFWRSNAIRRKQIEALKEKLQDQRSFIVAGDFNLVFENKPEKLFPSDWNDAWLLAHKDEPGLTWDPNTNAKAWWGGGFILPGYRLDRLLFKSPELIQVQIKRIGMMESEKLSDHYGLAAEFNCIN